MSTLISSATGNFTASGTWKLADSTTELDSEAASTATTVASVASAAFTPGAITVDAIGLKLVSAIQSAGTFTVDLFNSTSTSVVQTAVVNCTQLPLNGGWMVFTIPSTLLLAATNYQIRIKSSTAGDVTVFRNATAGNWSRQLRTTTNQAPAAGDKLIVTGEMTGLATANTFVVTMNNTATTSFGSSAFPQSISVNARSSLVYGTSASTNYYLRVNGIVQINYGGVFSIGTSIAAMPSTSTAVLEFNSGVNVDSGLVVGTFGTFKTFGNALSFDRTFLAADAIATATSLTTSNSTGWLSGDQIALASTTRTAADCEATSLTGNAVGTALAVGAIISAHSGTGATAGEVANLTRNVKIRGISTSLQGYILLGGFSVTDCEWTEFSQLGSATASKRGIDVNAAFSNVTFNRCSFHDYIVAGSIGINLNSGTSSNIAVQNNVMYNIHTNLINIPAALTVAAVINNNLLIKNIGAALDILLSIDSMPSFTNNTSVGATRYGMSISGVLALSGTFSGNTAHSCTSSGIIFGVSQNGAAMLGGTISNTTSWRNTYGLSTGGVMSDVTIDGLTAFGNSTANLGIGGATAGISRCYFNNLTLNAGTTLTCPIGIQLGILIKDCYITNSSLGVTTAHSTGDISLLQPAAVALVLTELNIHNTLLSSATTISNLSLLENGSIIGSQKHNQIVGSHKSWYKNGISLIDTSIFNTAVPSIRLVPNTASFKLQFSTKIPVINGSTPTFSIKVRKSSAGDGTVYNGNQPRLIVRRNDALGITSDTILATAAAAVGTWEVLSSSLPTVTDKGYLEIIVDCDGTQGWINIDDMSYVGPTTVGMDYWSNGVPISFGDSDSATLYTDPGINSVRSGVSYKFNSTTNNRTGNLVSPNTSTVQVGVTFDTSSSLVGTYDGSDRWSDPGAAVVITGVVYKANSTTNNRTGTLAIPTATQVASAVWEEPISGHVTAGTFGLLMQKLLTLAKFIGLK